MAKPAPPALRRSAETPMRPGRGRSPCHDAARSRSKDRYADGATMDEVSNPAYRRLRAKTTVPLERRRSSAEVTPVNGTLGGPGGGGATNRK